MAAGAVSFQELVHWPGPRVLLQRRPGAPSFGSRAPSASGRHASSSSLSVVEEAPARGHADARDDAREDPTELRRQLCWLQAQKKMEVARHKRFSKSASDSQIQAHRAKEQAKKHMFAMGEHMRALEEAEDTLGRLRAPAAKGRVAKDRSMQGSEKSWGEQAPMARTIGGKGDGTPIKAPAKTEAPSCESESGEQTPYVTPVGRGGGKGGVNFIRSPRMAETPSRSTMEVYGEDGRVSADRTARAMDTDEALAGIAPAAVASQESAGQEWTLSTNGSVDLDTVLDVLESIRAVVREECKFRAGGSAEAAFGIMNSTRSGRVSLHDFGASLDRLQVDWRGLTGLRNERHLFRIFDKNRNGHLGFQDLFPDETPSEPGKRDRKLAFLMKYNRAGGENADRIPRGASWELGGLEEEVEAGRAAEAARDQLTEDRGDIKLTLRRLRRVGRSDEQLKEVVVARLPKPTPLPAKGDPERRMQKRIGELKEQRRLLQDARQQLYTTCFEKDDKQRTEEQVKRSAIAGLSGLGLGSGLLSKVRSDAAPGDKGNGSGFGSGLLSKYRSEPAPGDKGNGSS